MKHKVQKEEKNHRSTKVFRNIRKERNCHPRMTRSLINPHSQQDASYYSNIGKDLLVFIYRCLTKCINQFLSNKCREKLCKVKEKGPCLGVWGKLSSLSSFIPKCTWRDCFTGGNFNGTKFNCVFVQYTTCVRFVLDKPGLCSACVRTVRRA
jgi:hypothetical protein